MALDGSASRRLKPAVPPGVELLSLKRRKRNSFLLDMTANNKMMKMRQRRRKAAASLENALSQRRARYIFSNVYVVYDDTNT